MLVPEMSRLAPYNCPLWSLGVCFVLLLGIISVRAQTQAPLTADSVDAPSPIVLDGGANQLLTGTFTNHEASPMQVDAWFDVTDTGAHKNSPCSLQANGSPFTANGNQPKTVQQTWNGRDGQGPNCPGTGQAFTTPVHVAFRVQVGQQNNAAQILPSSSTDDSTSSGGCGCSISRSIESHAIDIQSSTPTGNILPGQQWDQSISVTVTNLGDADRRIDLHLGSPSPNWIFSFSRDTLVTSTTTTTVAHPATAGGRGDSRLVMVWVTAPPGADSANQYSAKLTGCTLDSSPTSNSPTDCTQTSDPQHSVTLNAPPVGKGGNLILQLSSSPTAPSVPGGSASFVVTVTNGENQQEQVYPEADAINGDPLTGDNGEAVNPALSTTPVALAKNGDTSSPFTTTFPVTITIPTDTSLAGAHAGAHPWVFRVHGIVGGLGGTWFTLDPNFVVQVAPVYGGSVALVPPAPPAIPASTLTLPLQVCNQGNADDTLALEPQDLPDGWTADSSLSVGLLGAGACSAQLQWQVKVPAGAPAGSKVLDFAVRSQATGTLGLRLHVPITVQSVAVPRLTIATTPTSTISAGQTVTFPVTLANLGNQRRALVLASTIRSDTQPSATYSSTPSTTAWTWTQDPPGGQFTLDPGASTTVTYRVTAPSPADGLKASDLLHLGLNLTYTITYNDGTSKLLWSTLELRALQPFPDLAVSLDQAAPTWPLPAVPGHPVLFAGTPGFVHVKVGNIGAADSTTSVDLTVSFTVNGNAQPIPGLSVPPLHVGDFYNVNLTAPTAAAGIITMSVDADHAGVLADKEINRTNNLMVLLIPVINFNVQISGPDAVAAQPGQAVSFDGTSGLHLQNVGDPLNLTVTTTLTPGWKSFAPLQIVGLNQPAVTPDLILASPFVVPDSPGVESANLTIRVTPQGVPSVFVQHTVQIALMDGRGPSLGMITANPSQASPGQTVQFKALVAAATGIREARLYIIAPEGTVSFEPLTPIPGGNLFQGNHTFDEPGQFSLYLWAKDQSTNANVADGSSSPTPYTVTAGSAPALRLVSPTAGSPVRPGTPLVFAAFGPAPLQSIQVIVGNGQPLQLPPTTPVEVPTDGLADGPIQVNLTVTDILGATGHTTASFIIDGTPPDIRDIVLTPTLYQPGDRVRAVVHIFDASPLRSVELRLQDASGRVTSIPLNLTEGGAYGWFIAPTKTVLIQAVAEDMAGNRAFLENSNASLLGGKSAPAVGVLVFAVLLLTACLRRRRL